MTRARLLGSVLVFVGLAACGTLPGVPQCGTKDLGFDGVCVGDGGLAANTPLTIQVREGCGSLCGMNPSFACTASVDAGTIFLAATVTECTDPMAICPAACRVAKVDCQLPALSPGTYTVVGDRQNVTRQLVVSADAGASSCEVSFP